MPMKFAGLQVVHEMTSPMTGFVLEVIMLSHRYYNGKYSKTVVTHDACSTNLDFFPVRETTAAVSNSHKLATTGTGVYTCRG